MPLMIRLLKDKEEYREKYDYTDDVDMAGGVVLDYDKEGNVIGVEILSKVYEITFGGDDGYVLPAIEII